MPSAAISPTEVKTVHERRSEAWGTGTGSLTPQAYVAAGYGGTRRQCDAFFESLARARQNSDLLRRQLGLFGVASAGLLAAASASARAIATTAAGFTLTDQTVANVQEVMLFMPVGEEVRRLALEGMVVVENANPISGFGTTSAPTEAERWRAEQAVRSHAEACSLPKLTSYLGEALAARRVGQDGGATPALSAAAFSAIQLALSGSGISVTSTEQAAWVLAALRAGQPLNEAWQRSLAAEIGAGLPAFLADENRHRGARAVLDGAAAASPRFAALVQDALAKLTAPAPATLAEGRPAPLPALPAPAQEGGTVLLRLVPRGN